MKVTINLNIILDILILITAIGTFALGASVSPTEHGWLIFGLTVVISDSITYIKVSNNLPINTIQLKLLFQVNNISNGLVILERIVAFGNVALLLLAFFSLMSASIIGWVENLSILLLVMFVIDQCWLQYVLNKAKNK